MCPRQHERVTKMSLISDVQLRPVKTQYGIVGYLVVIVFKDGSDNINIYHDKNDNVLNEIE